jgi:hypothetical protein
VSWGSTHFSQYKLNFENRNWNYLSVSWGSTHFSQYELIFFNNRNWNYLSVSWGSTHLSQYELILKKIEFENTSACVTPRTRDRFRSRTRGVNGLNSLLKQLIQFILKFPDKLANCITVALKIISRVQKLEIQFHKFFLKLDSYIYLLIFF